MHTIYSTYYVQCILHTVHTSYYTYYILYNTYYILYNTHYILYILHMTNLLYTYTYKNMYSKYSLVYIYMFIFIYTHFCVLINEPIYHTPNQKLIDCDVYSVNNCCWCYRNRSNLIFLPFVRSLFNEICLTH